MALNDVDAAVESFKNALELEPNDGLFLLSVSLISLQYSVQLSCCQLVNIFPFSLGGIKKELAAAKKKVNQ